MTVRLYVCSAVLCVLPLSAWGATFSDVSADDTHYSAIESLQRSGVIQGYPDGTFRPMQAVSRAEAITLLLRPLLGSYSGNGDNSSLFTDVPTDAWFRPSVEFAFSKKHIIDGPPSIFRFYPERTVNKVEFLKMLAGAYGIDAHQSFAEIRVPLAADVEDPDIWFYPYVRYAITAGMPVYTTPTQILPAEELTRADVAELLYAFLNFRNGANAQVLLDTAERELIRTLQELEKQNIENAEFAQIAALLSARGALHVQPDSTLVKGVVRITEAFAELLHAEIAARTGTPEEVIRFASASWHKAEEAIAFSNQLVPISQQLQTLASSMADEARRVQ